MMKLKSKSKKKKQTPQQVSSARKCRTKTRKPKFLSLSKHIKSKTTPPPQTTTSSSSSTTTYTIITKMPHHHHHHPQLTLFPLHPENLTEDTAVADLLFHSDSLPGESSLTGLLSSEHSPSFDRVCEENDNVKNDESLVRAAMKRRSSERDAGEEKWVCYSEVVEEVTSSTVSSSKVDVVYHRRKKKKKTMNDNNCTRIVKVKDETTSSSVSQEGHSDNSLVPSSSLALKLDYQGILNAWSDKGSLYIQPPQTVPDLQYDHNHQGLMDGWGSSVGNLWKVPENDCIKNKEEMEGKEGWKLGQREASVLRYKEKRQSRLFAKRIRYEVRKLNAEKRPRMKGRFVKII